MKDERVREIIYNGIEFGLDKGDSHIAGSFISFNRRYSLEVGKVTKVWLVLTCSPITELGEVRWFGRWRKYGFFPAPDTVFEQDCLREIAFFCETATRFHKAGKKKAAAASISLHATE
jgi:hypothetical protein